VSQTQFPKHHASEVSVAARPEELFALLDDHARLARHMEKPSLMTAGGVFRVETDALRGRAVGSVIRMAGSVLGIGLRVEEIVTEYNPPLSKTWETRGEPRLLVVGAYRMGFTVAPTDGGSLLTVFIDYQLPERGVGRLLGQLFGRAYARWCTRRMAQDAQGSCRSVEPSLRPRN
jgi:hypothetical protein